jgi:hypothetical protein
MLLLGNLAFGINHKQNYMGCTARVSLNSSAFHLGTLNFEVKFLTDGTRVHFRGKY